jgi:hypothetical protein
LKPLSFDVIGVLASNSFWAAFGKYHTARCSKVSALKPGDGAEVAFAEGEKARNFTVSRKTPKSV